MLRCKDLKPTGRTSKSWSQSLACRTSAVTDLAWEAPLRIIRYPDPRLRARNARVGVFDERLARLSRELFEVMYSGCVAAGACAQQVVQSSLICLHAFYIP